MSSTGASPCGSEHVEQQAAGDRSSEYQAPLRRSEAVPAGSSSSTETTTSAVAQRPRGESSDSSFTPPGSPGGLYKESSVQELYQSARDSFGGELQPQLGDLVALEHPVRRGVMHCYCCSALCHNDLSGVSTKAYPAYFAGLLARGGMLIRETRASWLCLCRDEACWRVRSRTTTTSVS